MLGPTSLQILDLFLLMLQSGLPLRLLSLLSFQVELLVEFCDVLLDIGLGFVEIVFQHASHSVEFMSLCSVHFILESLLFLSLSFLLDLLIQPLFLFVLEEFPTRIILCLNPKILRSSP